MTYIARRAGCAALVFAAAAASASPPPDPGAAKRPFAIADFYRLTPVLEPAISPDARAIVYTVTTRNLERAKQAIHLWRVDADGAHARALTAGETTNQGPAFSPDGRRVVTAASNSTAAENQSLPAVDTPAAKRVRPVASRQITIGSPTSTNNQSEKIAIRSPSTIAWMPTTSSRLR